MTATPTDAGWMPIETAPKNRVPFIALNRDGECHVAAYDELGRLMRRSHQQRWAQSFTIEDGRKILTDEKFSFDTDWSLWTRGYEFKPTHWHPLSNPNSARGFSSAERRVETAPPSPSGTNSHEPVRETASTGDFKRVIPASDLQELTDGDTDAGGLSRSANFIGGAA